MAPLGEIDQDGRFEQVPRNQWPEVRLLCKCPVCETRSAVYRIAFDDLACLNCSRLVARPQFIANPGAGMPYSEFRFWSVCADQELIRLSMTDGRTQGEYFTFIKADDGRKYRERRDEALELIEQAISQGCEPGEVVRDAPVVAAFCR